MEHPCHRDSIVALKRIEGQVRGVQRMIEQGRYCVDILNQMRSVARAIGAVEKRIYKRHLENCVVNAFSGDSAPDKQQKIAEIMDLLSKYQGG